MVKLTRLYDWFGGVFAQDAESVLKFSAWYSDELQMYLNDKDDEPSKPPEQKWLEYDWLLNSTANKKVSSRAAQVASEEQPHAKSLQSVDMCW